MSLRFIAVYTLRCAMVLTEAKLLTVCVCLCAVAVIGVTVISNGMGWEPKQRRESRSEMWQESRTKPTTAYQNMQVWLFNCDWPVLLMISSCVDANKINNKLILASMLRMLSHASSLNRVFISLDKRMTTATTAACVKKRIKMSLNRNAQKHSTKHTWVIVRYWHRVNCWGLTRDNFL